MSKKYKVAKRFKGRVTKKSYKPGDDYTPPNETTAETLVSKGFIVATGKSAKASDAPSGDTEGKADKSADQPAEAAAVDLDSLKRSEIDELLVKADLDPKAYSNKDLAIEALKEHAAKASDAPSGDTEG